MENLKREKMVWRAGSGEHFYSEKGCYSATLLDGTHIEVHPDTYLKAFNAYLTLRGVTPTTLSEIIRKADAEWQAYYQLIDAFDENLQQWFNYHDPGIFIDLPRGQKVSATRTLSAEKRKMTWHSGGGQHCSGFWGYHSVCLENGTIIEVCAKTYDQYFNAYLNDLGVQRMSLFGIMKKADVEWQAYCQLMDAFADDIRQWLTFRDEGIFVTHPRLEG